MSKKMINREIGIMMRLQHPTIIQFYGYSLKDFEGHNRVTILMKLAKNGSLAKLLLNAQKGLAEENYDNTSRQKILIGIARAMMYLHQNHIIHRDLKPDNILLDDQYQPLITDFGLSKIYQSGSSQMQSQACGTSVYMAPEVIAGQNYNGKADVYSFAILMFEVVTDTTPYPLFQSNKMPPFQFNNKVVNEKYRPEFTVPVKESLKKLIEQCWSDDPTERPTFEEIFNKLAFNIDESVYDVFSKDNEFKFYLDDVDVDEVLNYAYDIADDNFNDKSSENSILIKKLEKKVDDYEKTINKLSHDNEKLLKDNEETKKQLNNLFDLFKKLSSDNEQLKKQLIDNEQSTDDKSITKSTKKSIKKDELDCTDGVFKYLFEKNSDPISFGLVEVIGNSYSRSWESQISKIICPTFNSYWLPEEKENRYFILNFKTFSVKITKYRLRVGNGSGDFLFKSWTLTGTNEKGKEIILDDVNNCSQITKKNPIAIIEIDSKQFVSSIKLSIKGRNEKGNLIVDVGTIELYGYMRFN